MRVRITRARQGEVDGVPLDVFEVGWIYDVPTSIATYLITTESAEPIDSDESAVVTPLSELRISSLAEQMRSVAADKARDSDAPRVISPRPTKSQ
jgi:hypothetical protein